MKDYKIVAVSEKIKNWDSKYGPMVTYYIKLDSEGDEAIQINKKSDSPIPKVGDELYGDIQQTEYGPKFKSAQKGFGDNARVSESSDTQDNIARSVALKAAADVHPSGTLPNNVLELADTFLAWLQNKPTITIHDDSQSKTKRDWDKLGKETDKPDKIIEDIGDEPIDLNSIPF